MSDNGRGTMLSRGQYLLVLDIVDQFWLPLIQIKEAVKKETDNWKDSKELENKVSS